MTVQLATGSKGGGMA